MTKRQLEVDWSDVACILTFRADGAYRGLTGRCSACGEKVAISRFASYPHDIAFICLDCELDRLRAEERDP